MSDDHSQEEIKTGFLKDSLAIKEKLDQVSPSLCLAKWAQTSIHLTTGLTQSCYHPPTHSIDVSELASNPSALHNTEQKKQERKMMLQGERPPGCSYCWTIEDASGNHLSDRHYRSGEDWARDGFDEIVHSPADVNFTPRHVEINFNHACNFACSYCGPNISSTWAKDVQNNGPYPTIVPYNDVEYYKKIGQMPKVTDDNNPYAKAFWEWWPQLYKEIKAFRMTGGEPLLDPNTYKVLDWINDHPRPDLDLGITTNFCVKPELIDKFIKKVKPIAAEGKVRHLMIYPSVDSWGEQAEYIRQGMDFSYFLNNVNRYLEAVPNGLLTFICTVNALSVPNLGKFLREILVLRNKYNLTCRRTFLDLPFLYHPSWQSLPVLPKKYIEILKNELDFMKINKETPKKPIWGFQDVEINRLSRVISWMEDSKKAQDPQWLLQQKVDFFRFFSEYDRRWNKDFQTTFPEFSEFWHECKVASDLYVTLSESE